MRRAICLFLVTVFALTTPSPAFAADDGSYVYGYIEAEFSDAIGSTEKISTMIANDTLYVDAYQIGERLGYSVETANNSDSVMFSNVDADNGLFIGHIRFFFNSTTVERTVYSLTTREYQSPVEPVRNDVGVWVPFEYTLLLLNSSALVVGNIVEISMPAMTVADAMVAISHERDDLVFSWGDDFGYDENGIPFLGATNHLINVFNGVLQMDDASLALLFQQFWGDLSAYDKKYGEKLALLLCATSDKEAAATSDRLQTLQTILSVHSSLSSTLENILLSDEKIGQLNDLCRKYLQQIQQGNSTAAYMYNRTYAQLEKALDPDNWAANLGGGLQAIQGGLGAAVDKAGYILNAAEYLGYISEFATQDRYAVDSLRQYLDRFGEEAAVPDGTIQAMEHYTEELGKNFVDYSTYRLIKEHWTDWFAEALEVSKAMGITANLELIAWNLASGFCPVLSDKLSAADDFELSMYASVFQFSALDDFQKFRDHVFEDEAHLTRENVAQLAQYCYVFLKSAYITRETAVASLKNLPSDTYEQAQPLIEEEDALNKRIAKYLDLMKASADGEYSYLGFLPEDNDEYLKTHQEDVFCALQIGSQDPSSSGNQGPTAANKVLLAVNQYDENGELVEAIHFDYDEDGLISRSYHDSYLNGILTDWGYDYIYTYDTEGRLISRYYYVDLWDGGFEDITRSYDSNGLLVSDNMYGEGEVSSEKEYLYDESGQLIREYATNGSPALGGRVENEYTYSYYTDEQGNLVGILHDEKNPDAEDEELKYNVEGQIIQGYEEDAVGRKIHYTHEYIDDPYFLVEDTFETAISLSGKSESYSSRYAYILDSAGQEIESFMLGSPETAQMNYDENGYLACVDNIENTYYISCEFIYGAPGEKPETSNTDTAQQLPPLSYEERTEHYDHVTSHGILTGTSDLAYPYFTDGSTIAARLNEYINDAVDDLRGTTVDAGEEFEDYEADAEEATDQGLHPGWDNMEISVLYNDNGLISLLYKSEDYYGSPQAHPVTLFKGHTYDIGTCEELDYRDLAGLKYRQMNACYMREAAAKGVSSPLDQAEAYVLSAEGLRFYCNVGEAVPREIVTVPFTSEYFDRAPAGGTSEGSDDIAGGSIDSIESNDSDQSAAGRVTLTVTGNAVNIRSGPGTSYASLGKVNKGDKLFSTGKSDNWYQVEYGDGTGYIIEDYVTIGTGGFYTAVDSGTLSVNGSDVNVRSGPGTEYQSIGKVSYGTTLTITGKSDNWYQVSYNGGTGYIIEDYVIKN